jgi:hypothetical protein
VDVDGENFRVLTEKAKIFIAWTKKAVELDKKDVPIVTILPNNEPLPSSLQPKTTIDKKEENIREPINDIPTQIPVMGDIKSAGSDNPTGKSVVGNDMLVQMLPQKHKSSYGAPTVAGMWKFIFLVLVLWLFGGTICVYYMAPDFRKYWIMRFKTYWTAKQFKKAQSIK